MHGEVMPLDCFGLHDWSEPYVERLKGARGVVILRKLRSCLACHKEVEVPESYEVERVTVYPCGDGSSNA